MDLTFFGALGDCKKSPRKPIRAKSGSSRPRFDFQFYDQWKFTRKTTPSVHAALDCNGVSFDGEFAAFAKAVRRPLTRLEMDFAWLGRH